MRLFIALDANKFVSDECKRLQALLSDGEWNKTLHYHITLKFLGEIQPEKLDKIKNALQQVKEKKIALQTTALGIFPNENYARVIWMGLNPNLELGSLQKSIDLSLEPLGFQREKEFQAHITLARVKFIKDKAQLMKIIKESIVKKIEIPVTEFVLYQSIRTNGHPKYEQLFKVELH